MRITLLRDYLSLRAVEIQDLELPQLSVICGLNGSGKSQLLGALADRQLTRIQLAEGPAQYGDVQLLTVSELTNPREVTGSGGLVDPETLYSQYTDVLGQVNSSYRVDSYMDEVAPASYSVEDHRRRTLEALRANTVLNAEMLSQLEAFTGRTFLELGLEDFQRYGPAVGVVSPFTSSLTTMFSSYRKALHNNALRHFYADKGGPAPLSDDEFVAHHGSEPWLLVDRAMKVMELPYSVTAPPEQWLPNDGLGQYSATFRNTDGIELSPDVLSTGEAVILRIACCLYRGNRSDFAARLPRVLLLDEVDACLHPSLISKFLEVLGTVFVRDAGTSVVITTHSPVTAALSPSGSMLEMRRQRPRLQIVDSETAVHQLSVGLPTLAVRVENQRHVFVESDDDKIVHTEFFNLLKGRIPAIRSLVFIPAGRESGGYNRVKQLVSDLRRSDVSSVFGLVDRDERGGSPEGLVHVEGRYSLENIVLDPLLVGAYLLRERKIAPARMGLEDSVSLRSLSDDDAQLIVDYIVRQLGVDGKTDRVAYCGGLSVVMPVAVLRGKGKDLWKDLLSAIPELKHLEKDKRYMGEIVSRIAHDEPDLIPQAVLDAYATLLA